MTDIFREVEEDVRRERIEKLWKQYGDYALAGIAVLIIAVAGWQFWKYYHAQQLQAASENYTHASLLAAGGDQTAAAGEFAKLAKGAPSGYAALARLQQANALMSAGQTGDAVTLYRQIEQGSDTSLGAIARLRHAWAIVDVASKADIAEILAPLNAPSSDWQYSAREVLAYADYHAGNTGPAVAAFKELADNTKAPANLRQRCQAMAAFLTAGAGRDVGNVPPAPPPVPESAAAATPNNGTPSP